MINKATLIGYVGNEPETRNFENDNKVTSFSLATSDGYKDKNGEWINNTEWHKVVAWNKLSDISSKILQKGSLVCIIGKIRYKKFTGKDGEVKYSTEIEAQELKLLSKKEDTHQQQETPQQNDYQTPSNPPLPNEPDDLPF